MGKLNKYEMPSASGSDYTWKEAILIPIVIFGVLLGGVAYLKWLNPSLDLERSHLYLAAYSHPIISEITGEVSNASFALVPEKDRHFFARRVPEDWKRRKGENAIYGTARMLIYGKKDGGAFTITYHYIPSTDTFTVVKIEGLDRVLFEKDASTKNQEA